MSSILFEENIKIFNQYKIQLITKFNLITINIQNDLYNEYTSNFNYEYFSKYKLLKGNETIQQIKQFIIDLIEQNNIKIEDNKNSLKLILISLFPNYPNVKLIIKKKNEISKDIIGKLFEEINKLNKENKELNEKIKLIKEENKKINEEIKNKIEEQNLKINDYEEKIKRLEGFHKEIKEDNSNKVQLTKCDLKMIKSIKAHKNNISSVSIFPSGNIISVSEDKSIKIYDNNYNILQDIQNAHNSWILYVDIKDDNNFVTCSDDNSIKTWIKNNNKFKINKIIQNAHNDQINKVIYYLNKNLISCSLDNKVKIWEEINNNYQLIKTLNHSNFVWSILLLEDKNVLISGGEDGINLWSLNNFDLIKSIKELDCRLWNALNRIDEDKIIIGGSKTLKIFSFSQKIILKVIKISFDCYGITIIKEKGIFFVGGQCSDIMIYRCDNYECIETIKNAHEDFIGGFIKLKKNLIASFSNDGTIKIWTF